MNNKPNANDLDERVQELRDDIAKNPVYHAIPEYNNILRALDLLARTEESTDELVQHLCEKSEDAAAARIILQLESMVALKAERDALKAHAEAMAAELNGYIGLAHPSLDAYRRDFQKDAP